MLYLTKEQVNNFEEWKQSFLDEINARLDTIRLVIEAPEEQPLYQKINNVRTKLMRFEVNIEKAKVNGTEVFNQMALGAMAEILKLEIEKIMEDNPDMFSARLKNLEEKVLDLHY